jgi:ABC-type phosphate/phosphonate transport system substrate-binding protein
VIASLPMYDRAEMRGATDRYWAAIRDGLRDAGIAAPDALMRDDDLMAQWTDPGLVLSQTCGYPYRARLHEQVTLIGTPDYGVEAAPPGHYRSVFVARADDPRRGLAEFAGARLAWNDDGSQSGWAGPMVHLTQHGIEVVPTLRTGGHRLSAQAVAEGRADLAGIDAVTWRLMVRWDRWTDGLRVVERTEPTPGLPYIAAAGADGAAMFHAIEKAIDGLAPEDREALGLRGIVAIPTAAYLAVPTPPAPDRFGHRI